MWLAVNIGNSRQHWGWFHDDRLLATSDYPLDYWNEAAIQPAERIVVASVVPGYLPPWHRERAWILDIEQIVLDGKYATLGIDRALNLMAAVHLYKAPALVVDFGTAITLSAIGEGGEFIGGSILPGLRLQLRALKHFTAALPEVDLPETLPPFLSRTTESAIQAGVLRVTLAGIEQLCRQWTSWYPEGVLVATGGDSARVHAWLPHLFDHQEPHLTLWGIFVVVQSQDHPDH